MIALAYFHRARRIAVNATTEFFGPTQLSGTTDIPGRGRMAKSLMAQILVLYNTPTDPAAFDRYYYETHIPIAKKVPGLRSYRISTGPVQALSGNAPHLVAILGFDSMADINAALASPEGQAAAADLPNFASGGAALMIFDTKPA